MTDFFGGLTGGNIRFTDARIDGDGPLPTSLSGPEGINGDPDGRYNFNDSLLSGITPYAFGQGRMGSDRNYQQIPNRKQFPVPPLWLPEPLWNTDTTFEVSHSVDMGDIAFILNVQHKQFMLSRGPYKSVKQDQDHTLPQWNVFCNICTVNYLLAGLHNFAVSKAIHGGTHSHEHAWYRLFVCLNLTRHLDIIVHKYNEEKTQNEEMAKQLMAIRCKLMLQQVVKQNIIPIGICSMSEKQGGQHEIGSKPVQAAANFFTTLTVDGQNRDLVNIWRAVEVDAGDFLILRLEFLEEVAHTKHSFVLNHYYKDTVTRTMCMHAGTMGRLQLVPDVFRIDNAGLKNRQDYEYVKQDHVITIMNKQAPKWTTLQARELFNQAVDRRYSGYWHIGQTYTKKQSFTTVKVPINDMEMTKGQLLQINFAPVWKGVIHGDPKNEGTNVQFCLAYALQMVMFSPKVLHTTINSGALVDATVSAPQQGPNVPPPAKMHRGNVPQRVGGLQLHQQIQPNFPELPLMSSVIALSADAAVTLTSANSAIPANSANSANSAISIAVQQSAVTTNSDWDFEKDIENMFAESTAVKPKVSRARAAKVVDNGST
jgi:hypothetical protein